MSYKKKHIFRDDKAKERIIKSKIKKYGHTKSGDFRFKEKLKLLDIVACNLDMGRTQTMVQIYEPGTFRGNLTQWDPVGGDQKSRAKDLIMNLDLRKLYRGGPGRKVDEELIIAAICIRIMREDNPRRGDIKYSNKYLTRIGLTKQIYGHINKKIDAQLDEMHADNERIIYEGGMEVFWEPPDFDPLVLLRFECGDDSFLHSFVLFNCIVPEDSMPGVVEYNSPEDITYHFPDPTPRILYKK